MKGLCTEVVTIKLTRKLVKGLCTEMGTIKLTREKLEGICVCDIRIDIFRLF